MPSMVSYPRRLQSGHITCYLNRTYHVLTTAESPTLAKNARMGHPPWEWCNAKMGHPPLFDYLYVLVHLPPVSCGLVLQAEGWGGWPAHVLVGRVLHGGAQAVICESFVEGHIATGWKIDKVGTELHSPPEVPCWLKYAQNASYREGKVLLCVSNEG